MKANRVFLAMYILFLSAFLPLKLDGAIAMSWLWAAVPLWCYAGLAFVIGFYKGWRKARAPQIDAGSFDRAYDLVKRAAKHPEVKVNIDTQH